MKTDWQKEMEKVTASLPAGGRPRLLLHACCAPCSSAVLERVVPFFAVTLFYYNPNIQPRAEFDLRAAQFPKLLAGSGLEGEVALLCGEYDGEAFLSAAKGLENEPEGGARCAACFRLRLGRTAAEAKRLGFDFFGTTLTVSPHKDAETINAVGLALAAEHGVRWLPADFKKKDGYLRSCRLSAQYGLYRQRWCGCSFAMPAEN